MALYYSYYSKQAIAMLSCLLSVGLLSLLLQALTASANPIVDSSQQTGRNESVSVLIIPSTKWCGNGNVATSYNNLGSEYETDKCCRDHDNCPNFIVGLDTRYGLKNPFLNTLSECECDVSFYFCLQQAAKLSTTAQFAIASFFRVLNVPCFELVQRPVCQRRQFPLGHCLSERNQTVAELRRLPFFADHLDRALSAGGLKFRGVK